MIGLIEDINIFSSFKKQSISYGKKENRVSHGFIFKISGYNEYFFGNKKMFSVKLPNTEWLNKTLGSTSI